MSGVLAGSSASGGSYRGGCNRALGARSASGRLPQCAAVRAHISALDPTPMQPMQCFPPLAAWSDPHP